MNLKTSVLLAAVAGVGVVLGATGTRGLFMAPGGEQAVDAGQVGVDAGELAAGKTTQEIDADLGQQVETAFTGNRMNTAAPAPSGMSQVVWDRAVTAYACAMRDGQIKPGAQVAIIDYDMPSSSKRLWVVDPRDPGLALNEWVAHGSGSGNLVAEVFSNTRDSHQTSLGVFRGAEVYQGKYGKSLRLDGLEPGFNDAARDRAIVVHEAWYAEPSMIAKTGRLGRSQGCPAVRPEAMPRVRAALADGGMLFAHASDEAWLERSRFLNCG